MQPSKTMTARTDMTKRLSRWALPTHMTSAQPTAMPTKTVEVPDYDAVLAHLQTHGFMVLYVPVEDLRVNAKQGTHEAPDVKKIVTAAYTYKWPKLSTYRIDETHWLILLSLKQSEESSWNTNGST